MQSREHYKSATCQELECGTLNLGDWDPVNLLFEFVEFVSEEFL